MGIEIPDFRDPNIQLRIPVVGRAIADVIHEHGIALLGRFNEGMSFNMSRKQERIIENGPVTFSQAMERYQSTELS